MIAAVIAVFSLVLCIVLACVLGFLYHKHKEDVRDLNDAVSAEQDRTDALDVAIRKEQQRREIADKNHTMALGSLEAEDELIKDDLQSLDKSFVNYVRAIDSVSSSGVNVQNAWLSRDRPTPLRTTTATATGAAAGTAGAAAATTGAAAGTTTGGGAAATIGGPGGCPVCASCRTACCPNTPQPSACCHKQAVDSRCPAASRPGINPPKPSCPSAPRHIKPTCPPRRNKPTCPPPPSPSPGSRPATTGRRSRPLLLLPPLPRLRRRRRKHRELRPLLHQRLLPPPNSSRAAPAARTGSTCPTRTAPAI